MKTEKRGRPRKERGNGLELLSMVAKFPRPVMEWLNESAVCNGRSKVKELEFRITEEYARELVRKKMSEYKTEE